MSDSGKCHLKNSSLKYDYSILIYFLDTYKYITCRPQETKNLKSFQRRKFTAHIQYTCVLQFQYPKYESKDV